MLTKQIELYKNIYRQALSMVKETELSCRQLRDRDQESTIGATRRYALPFIALISLSIFVGYFINAKNPQFEFAVLKTLFNFLAITTGYLLSVIVCKKTTAQLFHYNITQKEAETVIAYSSTTIFSLHIIMAFFPGFFFLQLLGLHTLYLLWCMSSDYIQIEERYKTYFMLLNTTSIVLLPINFFTSILSVVIGIPYIVT